MDLIAKEESGVMLLRELVFGAQKSRKTWWAAAAAEAGFNVLLLDGDDGWHILKHIASKAKKRIQVVDCVDTLDRAAFAVMFTTLMKKGKIVWDETTKRNVALKPAENAVSINLLQMGVGDLLIVDSWSALIWSLTVKYAAEQNIDLADLSGDEDSDQWGFYRWGGRLATWMLSKLKSLPCHVIVIGHTTIYEKYSGTKRNRKMVLQREQVSSISGPHAMQMGTYFSDILQFKRISEYVTKIETYGTDEKEGGSRIVKPGTYDWEKLQFGDICKIAGIPLPGDDNPLIDYTPKISTSQTNVPTGGAIEKTKGKVSISLGGNKPQIKL